VTSTLTSAPTRGSWLSTLIRRITGRPTIGELTPK